VVGTVKLLSSAIKKRKGKTLKGQKGQPYEERWDQKLLFIKSGGGGLVQLSGSKENGKRGGKRWLEIGFLQPKHGGQSQGGDRIAKKNKGKKSPNPLVTS